MPHGSESSLDLIRTLALALSIRDSSRMSLAELKDEIAKLSPDELAELRRELLPDPFDDPAYREEMARRYDDFVHGRNIVTKDEMYARLRAAGRNI